MKFNFDSLKLGLILGILTPAIVFLCYYLINYHYMTSKEFFRYLALAKTSSSITSLCVLANLPTFYIFIQKEKYLSARGVLFATFIYAGLVCYLRFFTPSL
jgi:hypothetical protein